MGTPALTASIKEEKISLCSCVNISLASEALADASLMSKSSSSCRITDSPWVMWAAAASSSSVGSCKCKSASVLSLAYNCFFSSLSTSVRNTAWSASFSCLISAVSLSSRGKLQRVTLHRFAASATMASVQLSQNFSKRLLGSAGLLNMAMVTKSPIWLLQDRVAAASSNASSHSLSSCNRPSSRQASW